MVWGATLTLLGPAHLGHGQSDCLSGPSAPIVPTLSFLSALCQWPGMAWLTQPVLVLGTS